MRRLGENFGFNNLFSIDENGLSHVSGVALHGTVDISSGGGGQSHRLTVVVTGALDSSGDRPEINVTTIRLATPENSNRDDPLQSGSMTENILPDDSVKDESDKPADVREKVKDTAGEAKAAEEAAKKTPQGKLLRGIPKSSNSPL